MAPKESAAIAHREVLRLMQARDWRGADAACRHLNAKFPQFAGAWFAASHIAMAQGAAAPALDAIDKAVALEPENPTFRLHRATCLMALHRRREALDAADAAQRCAPADPTILDAVGTLRSRANEQPRALDVGEEVVAEPRALAGAFDETRDVGDDELTVAVLDRAQDRHQRGERVAGDLRVGPGDP